MTRKPTPAQRQRAGQLRAVLEQLDSGRVAVKGDGHSTEQTRARLEAKLRRLEGDRG